MTLFRLKPTARRFSRLRMACRWPTLPTHACVRSGGRAKTRAMRRRIAHHRAAGKALRGSKTRGGFACAASLVHSSHPHILLGVSASSREGLPPSLGRALHFAQLPPGIMNTGGLLRWSPEPTGTVTVGARVAVTSSAPKAPSGRESLWGILWNEPRNTRFFLTMAMAGASLPALDVPRLPTNGDSGWNSKL